MKKLNLLNFKLGFRLAITITTLLFIILSILLYLNSKNESERVSGEYRRDINVISKLLTNTSAEYILSYDLAQLDLMLKNVMDIPSIIEASFVNNKGQSLSFLKKDNQKTNYIESYSFPIVSNNEEIGKLELKTSLKNVQEDIKKRFRNSFLISLGFSVLLILTLLFFLDRIILKQIVELTKASRKLSEGDLEVSAKVVSSDELAELAKTFNETVIKLKKLDDERVTVFQNSKLASMGELAGGIAHEINNPLMIIKGNVGYISKHLGKADFANKVKVLESLEAIESTIERMSSIITSLLKLSRNNVNESMRPHKVKEIFENVTPLLLEKFKLSGVKTNILEIEKFMNIEFCCKPLSLSQVLLNLGNNAFDALESNNVENPFINFEIKDYEDQIEIAVVNNGPIIEEKIREKILQPFFTTKEVGKGTGLGLSLSKKIIEQHQGKFFLDNDPELTRFVIQIPKTLNCSST